ncbi:Alpha-1,2 mannosyltransferase KTR1 [Metarhizium anisopliae]|nr:Alpha-1,2 mannosyltransferase KTR1 [Metarhizium anisopliae]
MHQLEDAFNSRYNYDWVFFSTAPLSEEFRRLTSNATTATCVYEVVHQGDVPLRHREKKDPISQGQPSQTSQEAASPTRGDTFEPPQTFRQLQRWNNGPFAKEKRLQTYDWFWRIEPGAQFTHDIGFDIFRFMRDHNIAYGSSKANFTPLQRSLLSHQVKRFLEKHPDLLHAEADVAWLLGLSDNGRSHGDSLKSQESNSDATQIGSQSFSAIDKTDDDATTPAEAFTNWLVTFYKSGTSAKFDIGSLSFFRSHSHQVLLDHFDGYDSQYEQDLGDILVPTISASMFLPQKSVWNLRQKDRGYNSWPHPPDSTPEPKLKLWHRMKRAVRNDSYRKVTKKRQKSLQDGQNGLTERFALWDVIAEDFGRQATIPGLRSGNTVIDERNFALS